MKNSIYGLLAFLFTLFIIQGCQKLTDPTLRKGQLVVSKSVVKINEPDSLLLVGAPASDSIKWSVTPAGHDTLLTKNNAARVVFTKAGSYTVKVSDNGGAPASAVITVNDSVYKAPPGNTSISLIGDQITLFPYFYKSKNTDSTYLAFTAVTKNYYCATDKLNVKDSLVNNNFGVKFINVTQYGPCNSNSAQLSAGILFNQHPTQPLNNGTYPLKITLNDTTYTGNIVVSTSTISFTWPNSSRVMFSTTQINK